MARTRKDRRPRAVTAESLRASALAYLERYASSAANLRSVLQRRILRAARFHDIDARAAEGWADAIVQDFVAAGLLDDGTYAEARVRTMFREGRSRRAMRLALRQKGVAAETVEAALAQLDETHAVPDFAAAVQLARRRGLGPWRREDREAMRMRDLAALARAGFSYDVARAVVDAESTAALEDALTPK